jgi:hypothetical protein
VNPDISEFSYGYALTEQLIHNSDLQIRAAPIFPSLIEEGKPGGGYDVQLPFVGFALFLQFKLADRMIRDTAFEVKKGLMTTPFYRMHLRPMKHSIQHQLLLSLEAKGEMVYYAAPHFHKPAELDDAYRKKRVRQRSIFVKPSTIGPLPTPGYHHIAFHNGQQAHLCSDPRPLQGVEFADTFEAELVRGVGQRPMLDGSADSVGRLASEMVACVKETVSGTAFQHVPILDREPRFQIAYLARAYFGCEILLIGNATDPKEPDSTPEPAASNGVSMPQQLS